MSKTLLLFVFSLNLSVIIANKATRHRQCDNTYLKTGTENENKIIIDNDAGADDALAIFMTLLYEKYYGGPQLIALTTGNGNTVEDNVNINNQKILRTAKRQDVPIYRGSNSSIVITPIITDNYFGEDGLGENDEPLIGLVPAQTQNAVETLLEMSKKHEGKLTVITIGALTNVALAIKLDPKFFQRLTHLYVGAGHIESDRHPEAEFNAHIDVEAYRIITQYATPDKVTVVPFSQIYAYLNIDMDWRENVFGKINTDMINAFNIYERVSLHKEESWVMLDPAVIAIALSNIPLEDGREPDFVTNYKFSKNDIILCGEKRGINTNSFAEKENANVRLAYSFDLEKYKTFLMDVFTAELQCS